MALVKAIIINQDAVLPIPIPVMFNPPEYRLERANQFTPASKPGIGANQLQFVHAGEPTLSMELFFDTTSLGVDARLFTRLVLNLMDLNAETHAPPRLLFVWGSLLFPCVLVSASQQYDHFNALGFPLRARLNVTFQNIESAQTSLAKIAFASPDRFKSWVFKEGDTLQRIAAQEYGDARQWRAIALASGINNPLTIRPGTRLVIPTLPM